jgi:hypothetical protein
MGGFHVGIGASPEAAGSALAGLGQRLRTAADQQAQLVQQQQKQEMSEQMDMARLVNEGWQIYEPSRNVTTDSTGLKRRDFTPPPANMVELPTLGKRLYKPDGPTPAQKTTEAREGGNDLRAALEKGGQPVSPQGTVNQNTDIPRIAIDSSGHEDPDARVGPARGTVVPVPDQGRVSSAGGQKVYMPSEGEKSEQALREKTRQTAAVQDAEGWTLPDSLARAAAKHAGLPEDALVGVKLPHEVVSDAFKKGTTAEKPDKFTYNRFTDDAGKVNVTRIGEDGVPQKWNGKDWTTLGAGEQLGPKKKDPDASRAGGPTPGQADVQGRFNQREMDQGQRQQDALQELEQKQHDRRNAWGAAVKEKNGTTVIDPETGKEVTMSDARRKTYSQKIEDAGTAVSRLQERQKAIRQRFGWGEFGGDQQGGTTGGKTGPASGVPTRAGQTQEQKPPKTRGKLTNKALVSHYVQRAGGDNAKARKLAAADGWEF